MRGPVDPRWRRYGPITLLCAIAFAFYAHHRVRQVGGCDEFAYHAQAQLFLGRSWFRTEVDVHQYPAVVPLCLEFTGSRLVGVFPIGYPLLLAAGGLVRAEFFVTPVLGVVSIVLLYVAMLRIAGQGVALGLATLWAASPSVTWGATSMMSDLPASVFVLGAYVALSRGRSIAAGGLLAFSFAIRPTNLIVLPLFALVARRGGELRPFSLATAVAAAYVAVYEVATHGTLFAAGYRANTHGFGSAFLQHNLELLLVETFLEFWPVLLLAAFALARRVREKLLLLAWFFAYLGVYGVFRELDAWWYVRYLLPGYPALFLLAAHGARELAVLLRRTTASRSRAAVGVAALLGAAMVGISTHRCYEIVFGPRPGGFFEDSRRVAKIVPPGSLVGALTLSGPLRLYGRVESFDWAHPQAPELVDWALEQQRAVYLVIEPGELVNNWLALRYLKRYELEDVAELSAFPGLKLKRVDPKTTRGHRDSRPLIVDVGTPGGRSHLRDGWAGDERDQGRTYAWVVGRHATLSVALTPGQAQRITISASSIPTRGTRQRLSIRVNRVEVAVLPLSRESDLVRATVPGRLIQGDNLVELGFAVAIAPSTLDPASQDQRELAATVDFVSFTPIEDEGYRWFDRRFVNFDEGSKDALGPGWSGIELEPNGDTLCWCAATSCTLRLRGRPFAAATISARLSPFTEVSGPPQTLRLFLNGVSLGERVLPREMAVASFEARSDAWRSEENELRFDFARADRPRSGDRTLAARFDWVEVASR